MKTRQNIVVLAAQVLVVLFGVSTRAYAWGERGHHAICAVATRLVGDKNLAEFTLPRLHVLGHLCNVPDIYWRSLPDAKSGDATHFMNPENLQFRIDNVPLDFAEIQKSEVGQKLDVPAELGSLWWRANQFFIRALSAAKLAKTATLPQKSQEQDPDLLFNHAVYEMMVNMGLLGHFVGDASMPYHNTKDYDGWGSGHGGIHSHFETDCVNELPLDLEKKVFDRAKLLAKTWKPKGTVIERMKALSTVSLSELHKIEALDKVISPSSQEQKEGLKIKKKAERKSARDAAKSFAEMIVTQLARSSLLLSEFWNEIYLEGGAPELSKYRSYQYPLTPPFVAPDYVEIKSKEN